MYILGFDIGGTKCAVLLGEVAGDQVKFYDRFQAATDSDWKNVLDMLAEHGAQMLEKNDVCGKECRIGISCGGPLSADRKRILSPPNLPGWDDVPVVDYLSGKLGMPAKMENDADACALAEWKFGAGRGSSNMIFLTFGTGLGAGLILNGKLYKGACGMAGEVGHIRLAGDGPEGYGKAGSFEGFCSGGGIRKLAIQYALENGVSDRGIWKEPGKISAKALAKAAEEGDVDAIEVFRISGKYFGRGLAVLIDLLNPEVIVAGSIYARCKELLDETMIQEIQKEALPQTAAVCGIRPAQLGEQIGDYGSVMAALEL